MDMRINQKLNALCALLAVGLFCSAAAAQQSAVPDAPAAQSPAEFSDAQKSLRQGKVDEALVKLQAVEKRAPSTKGLSLELGTAYYKKSDFGNAIEYLQRATAEDPPNGE